jgi:predicted choloylglycine hydrolase
MDFYSSWAGNIWNKMKNKKYYTVWTVPEYNRKIVDTLAKSRFFLLEKEETISIVYIPFVIWFMLLNL